MAGKSLGSLVLCAFLALLPNVAQSKDVEILRDTWGIPHVFAETDAGAFYGLGYATAQDRAFQMHFNLRIIQGRLAEVVGERPHGRRKETSVQNDVKMRTFGFYRAAQAVAGNLDAESRSLLEAYSAGVNRYLDQNVAKLNPLFKAFDLIPEPWTSADCIVSWWHVGQFFGTDGTREMIAWRNQQGQGRAAPGRAVRGGRGGRAMMRPPQIKPDDSVAVIQEGDLPSGWIDQVNTYLKQHGYGADVGAVDRESPAGPKFSHAWVVGKQRTNTGSSVLVSDPQTPVNNPSLFYEFHIQGKTFNARGIGVPGSPVVLIGFSENVAWGCTALGADQADLFRLTTAPDKPDQYQVDGQWQAMQVRQETVKVKGGKDRKGTLRETRFGPVVTAFAFARPHEGEVAVKRIPICETDRETIQGAIGMLRARNVREFDKALEGWRFPSVNSLFGDRHGDIGFRTAVAQPLRAPGVTSLNTAQNGSRSRNDWQGIVPHALMPHVINPQAGALFSGNHRAIGAYYHVPIGNATGSQGDTVRSWRLRELVTARETYSAEDVLQIHYDTVNPSHRDIVQLAYYLRDEQKVNLSEPTRQALDFLVSWREQGCRMDNHLHGTALVANLNTMFRVMNTELAMTYGGGQTGLCRFMQSATGRTNKSGGTLTEQETRYIDTLLADAWRKTAQQYGADPKRWMSRHQAGIVQQKLAYFQSLDGYGSLNQQHDLSYPALFCTDGNTILSQRAQSYTQFVPMHDPDQAQTLLPIGQSEIPGHPSFANLKQDWAQGRLHAAPLSRKAVEKIAGEPVVLRVKIGIGNANSID